MKPEVKFDIKQEDPVTKSEEEEIKSETKPDEPKPESIVKAETEMKKEMITDGKSQLEEKIITKGETEIKKEISTERDSKLEEELEVAKPETEVEKETKIKDTKSESEKDKTTSEAAAASSFKEAEDDLIEVEDNDDYLMYLEDILKTIHKAYFDLYDQVRIS